MQPIKLNEFTVVKISSDGEEIIIKQYDEVKEKWDLVVLKKDELTKIMELVSVSK